MIKPCVFRRYIKRALLIYLLSFLLAILIPKEFYPPICKNRFKEYHVFYMLEQKSLHFKYIIQQFSVSLISYQTYKIIVFGLLW